MPRVPPPPSAPVEVRLQAPSSVARPAPVNIVMRLLPLAMLVAVVGMTILFVTSDSSAVRNPAMLMFPLMMVVSTVAMMSQTRGGTRGEDVDSERRDYLRHLANARDEVADHVRAQRESLVFQHPDPAKLWAFAGDRRMWERGDTDSDFCHARVGLGTQRSTADLVVPEMAPPDDLEPVAAGLLRSFVTTHSITPSVPIALALNRFDVISVEGDEQAVRGLVRAVLCQLCVLHGPHLVAVAMLVDGEGAREWDWMKWFPHYRRAGVVGVQVHTIAVADGAQPAAIRTVLARGGVTVLHTNFVANEGLRPLRLRATAGTLAAIGDCGDDGYGVEEFAVPDTMSRDQAEACARRVARYGGATGSLTTRATQWPALLGLGEPATADPTALWRARAPRERLRVPIGTTSDGTPLRIDLKEAAEGGMGPHGLCIGATGSGKSEFLRTLTLGLVATHPPEALNLVLVDFKGGATFPGFERLRHVAAVITNLADEAPLVARMKDALAGEVHRRQELLRAAGNFANVAEYERAREAGTPLSPLPTLVVIVDEFSELLSQHPDFAELFVAIGRLGRSLRIHLLLASQRLDEGRLRGLDSHLSYRVCLKTFSASESRATIGVADAYELPAEPGAAYLRTSVGDLIRFRAAYVSGPYGAPAHTASSAAVPVVRRFTASDVVDTVGPHTSQAPHTTLLAAMVERLAGRGAVAHRVWLAPLSESPSLANLIEPRHLHRLVAPIGVVDRPFDQRRAPLLVELSGAAGNVAIVGAPQSGKTTAVRTLASALAAAHSVSEVQVYCLDFGGGGLATLSRLPHVGSVAGRAHRDLVRRTVAEMTGLLRLREAQFRELGIGSMSEYRRRRAAGDQVMTQSAYGDVFLVVDGWSTLRAEFDALEAPITALAAQGLSYGIHVVLTATRWAEIRPAVKDQLGTRIELRLGDPADSELNRRAAQSVPVNSPGRGITADGNHMLIARPDAGDGLPAGDGQCAPAVRLLPAVIDHGRLVDGRAGGRRTDFALGVDENDLATVTIDFAEHPHLVVLGESECGKTSALRLLCAELVRLNTAAQARVMIVDVRRSLLGAVESGHLFGYAMSASTVAAHLPSLLDELERRMPGPSVDQQQLRTRSWWSGPELFLMVDDYDILSSGSASPLSPIVDYLPHAKDLGFHVVIARRSGGAGRALYEPVLSRMRDLGCATIVMSAAPDDGPLAGSVRPTTLPPGRGTLVTRSAERLIQLGWVPPCP